MRDLVTEFSSFGDDYIFTRLTGSELRGLINKGPIRSEGMAWILCLSGELELEINLKRCAMYRNTLMVFTPGSIVDIKSGTDSNLDIYALFVAPGFLRNINIDPNMLAQLPIGYARSFDPVMSVTTSEVELLRCYFDLLHRNATVNPNDLYVRSISANLIAAMLYQVVQFASRRYDVEDTRRPRSRRSSYVQDFMSLLHSFHTRERSVSFYAGKLFISAKYLSMLVKEQTGRSAAEWIDEFVILEAKNLLKFSGKNVQQVAYELNFPNQSSFGKYFKHLTGMSPTTYQKS